MPAFQEGHSCSQVEGGGRREEGGGRREGGRREEGGGRREEGGGRREEGGGRRGHGGLRAVGQGGEGFKGGRTPKEGALEPRTLPSSPLCHISLPHKGPPDPPPQLEQNDVML